jgi:hypothetical protein
MRYKPRTGPPAHPQSNSPSAPYLEADHMEHKQEGLRGVCHGHWTALQRPRAQFYLVYTHEQWLLRTPDPGPQYKETSAERGEET